MLQNYDEKELYQFAIKVKNLKMTGVEMSAWMFISIGLTNINEHVTEFLDKINGLDLKLPKTTKKRGNKNMSWNESLIIANASDPSIV